MVTFFIMLSHSYEMRLINQTRTHPISDIINIKPLNKFNRHFETLKMSFYCLSSKYTREVMGKQQIENKIYKLIILALRKLKKIDFFQKQNEAVQLRILYLSAWHNGLT